jgi:hypothetical protein
MQSRCLLRLVCLKRRLVCLCNPKFPLSQPFPADFDISSIDSWEKYYEIKGYALDNPVALVLEIPLTIWHLINKFYLKDAPPIPEGGLNLS